MFGRATFNHQSSFCRCLASIPLVTLERQPHVVVVGGGAIGASAALWLRTLARSVRVTVVERDSTYSVASTPRSVGGVRLQFSCPENVQLSHFGIQYVKSAAETLGQSVGYRPSGYLFLATPAGEETLRRAHAMQIGAGASVELIDAPALAAAYPWLNTDGLTLGSRGEGEGGFDPHLYLTATRQTSIAKGVEWFDGTVKCLGRGRGCESSDAVRQVSAVRSGRAA
jgi:FAD-dependent oxidoreductase domain-containing protein 1